MLTFDYIINGFTLNKVIKIEREPWNGTTLIDLKYRSRCKAIAVI